MKKLLVLALLLLTGCSTQQPTFSNLADTTSQTIVAQAMQDAGISEAATKDFLTVVTNYNVTVENTSLIKEGFVEQVPQYDELALADKWEEKNGLYIGNNCRITSFGLMNDLIDVTTATANDANLFMDKDAINYAPTAWLDEDTNRFTTLFGFVPTPNTKDITVHVANLQQAWQERGIHFKANTQAKLISVVMHSTLDDQLFIGHVGVLVPYKDGYLFIEKLSFQEPYQAVQFADKEQLNTYLMTKYDVSFNQPEAKPFIMENDQLLATYQALDK